MDVCHWITLAHFCQAVWGLGVQSDTNDPFLIIKQF